MFLYIIYNVYHIYLQVYFYVWLYIMSYKATEKL